MANRNEDEDTEQASVLVPDRLQPFIIKKTLLEQNKEAKNNELNFKSLTVGVTRNAKSARKAIIHQILLTSAVIILAAACGMPIGYSAVMLPQLYNSNDSLTMDIEFGSWFASVHSLAAPVGSFASGPIMDYLGRRPTLMLTVLPLLLGWTLIGTATNRIALLIGRMSAGMSVGLMAAPAQVLIAESAEPRIRGFLTGVPFVSYSLGILLTYTLGALLHWRSIAWCCTILPTFALLAIFFVPDSPVWLARKGHLSRAEKALRWLRCNDEMAKMELQDLLNRNEMDNKEMQKNENIWQTCAKLSVLKPLIIINGFHIMVILSGTYLIVFYAVDIISDLGSDINSMTAAVYTAIVRLIFTIFSCVMLYLINRRTMIISAGICAALSTIGLSIFIYSRLGQPKTPIDLYVSAGCILFYIASTTGFMIMPGVMVGELLPARVRGRVSGYIFAGFNLLFFTIAKIFPFIHQAMKTQGIFILFGIASLVAAIFLFLMLPETKGKSLGEIEDYFQANNWLWANRPDKIRRKEQIA